MYLLEELQTKLNQYLTTSLTSLQKLALNRLFENFFCMFSYIHFSKTQSFTLILLIITFYLTSITKAFQVLSILVMRKLAILLLILQDYIMISEMSLLHLYMNSTVHLFLIMIHYSFIVLLPFINTVLYYIILFITLSQRMNSNSLQAQNS